MLGADLAQFDAISRDEREIAFNLETPVDRCSIAAAA
jgi:hypothetical protein